MSAFSNQIVPGNLPANSVNDTEIDWGTGTNQVEITDMPADNWKVFYSNGTGVINELSLGAATQVLTSNGAAAAPTFEAAAISGASAALDNLAAVAINTSLISDTDITDDLGTGDLRWKDIHAATLNSGLTASDTLILRGRDVDGSVYVDILTITSANDVTADLNAITTIGGNSILNDGTDVTVAQGGTGRSTATEYGVICGGTTATGAHQSIASVGTATQVLTSNGAGALPTFEDATGSGGANTALSNLASVAINLSLTSDTDITDDLGTGDLRWRDLHCETVNAGLTAADTLKLRARDVDGAAYVDILTITSADTVTADLNAITTIGGNSILNDGTDVTVAQGGTGRGTATEYGVLCGGTTATGAHQSIASVGTASQVLTSNGAGALPTFQDATGSGGANTALSNLASVAINLSLTSDTDITDDLGTGDVRWKDIHAATLNSGLTAADTLKLRGYDNDGTAYVDILTITSNNTVTADLNAITTIGGNAILDATSTISALTTVGTIDTGVWTGTDIAAADGGTGRSSHTAYAVICGGTTTTAAQQSIASVGTATQVLTSNGAGALPTFQDATGGSSTFWTDDGLTTTYVSATTFTIASSDETDVFQPGRLIEITNTGVNSGNPFYVRVQDSSFSTDTTVTINALFDLVSDTLTVKLSNEVVKSITYSDRLTIVADTSNPIGSSIIPCDCQVLGTLWRLDTSPTGSAATADIHIAGTTVHTSKPSISASGNLTAFTRATTTTAEANDYIEFFVDSVGSTIAGGSPYLTVFFVPQTFIDAT